MQSKAKTVAQYLAELPEDRRAAVRAVRDVILANLDSDYEEGMQYGMIGYYVPHRVFPAGYHCDPKQPLPFAGLASQKNHMSVYMMSSYGSGIEHEWLMKAWAKTGKKLDMGKCCIRFKKLEDLPLDVIGEAIRRVPAAAYVAHYESVIRDMGKKSRAGAKSEASKRTSVASRAATRSARAGAASASGRPGVSAKTGQGPKKAAGPKKSAAKGGTKGRASEKSTRR